MAPDDADVKITGCELLSVGKVAEASSVSTRSIRYYEEQGLLESQLTAAGHRRCTPETIVRVILIQRLFAAGLTSREIEPVLPCMIDESARTSLLVDVLREYRERVAQEIRKQRETVRILDEVIDEYDTVYGSALSAVVGGLPPREIQMSMRYRRSTTPLWIRCSSMSSSS